MSLDQLRKSLALWRYRRLHAKPGSPERTLAYHRILRRKKQIAHRESLGRVSANGLNLIASFEGFIAVPYNDAAGHATIGYGHLIHYGNVTAEDRHKWGRLTRTAGLRLLHRDLATREHAVRDLVKVPLKQGQFDALVSFVYNVGEGAFAKSTVLHRLNGRDYYGAANGLLAWDKAGGRRLPGLTRRRQAERNLFLGR